MSFALVSIVSFVLNSAEAEPRADGRIEGMKSTLEDGLRALAEATELARSIRIELDDNYLALIARVEAMPRNQSGADKSWVWRMDEAFRDHYRRATPA